MKLVDWDKVKISYNKQVSGTITEPIYNIKVEAPTVEAIPIDWLRMWFTKKASLIGITLMSEIESDWEKENGSNR